MDTRLVWMRSYIDRAKMLQKPDVTNVECAKPDHSDSEESDYDTSSPIISPPQSSPMIVDKPLCLHAYVKSQRLVRRVAGNLQAS